MLPTSRSWNRRALVALALVASLAAPAGAGLEEYLARPEPKAGWTVRAKETVSDVEHARVELVSQTWRGREWRHDLDVFRPSGSGSGLAVLFVTAGRGWLSNLDSERRLAAQTGATVAVLGDVPNQPLFGRTEDDLIAYTFEQYLRSGDPEWPLLFPMTKSAVAAMNAVSELAKREWKQTVDRFVVTGASKRGWTTWLAAALDPRVVGIAPLVFDNLRFEEQLENQLATWGRYSEQLGDYTERGLPALTGTSRGRTLVAEVDPWSHRERLGRIRKLIVNGTNDRYWALGALNFYWDGLAGEKSVLYVPNGGHSLSGTGLVRDALVAFVRRIIDGRPMPTFETEGVENGRSVGLRVKWNEPAENGHLWWAASQTADFRSARWQSIPATRDGDWLVATVERAQRTPRVAVFGEGRFGENGGTFSVSTPVHFFGAADGD